ncbi:MAG: hypothetical protein GX250_04420, partial [Clostridiales bacterium]|nr:hypothetical protein [Clostridiales bacterium]
TMTYTYNLVAYFFFAVYFIAKFSNMTLSEIGENKWYLLSKMGYNVTRVILYKMFTTIVIVMMLYTTGFALAMLLSSLFKYVFVIDYFLPAFVSGALNVLLIVQAALVFSLFSQSKNQAKNYILVVIIVNEVLKFALGYYKLVTNRVLMSNVLNLFDPDNSIYGIVLLTAVSVLALFSYIGARKKSDYYSLKGDVSGLTIVKHDGSKIISPHGKKNNVVLSIPSILFKALLVFILICSMAFNALILIASLGSNTKEFSVFGYIPYIIKSQTMEDAIYKNDLALFKRIDSQYPLEAGDIVLFPNPDNSNDVYIMEVVDIEGENVVTDMKKYPVLVEKGKLQQIINRKAIYGLFYDNYRVLGAIVLFINTFPGRVISLFLPVIMLFFYSQITAFIRRFKAAL